MPSLKLPRCQAIVGYKTTYQIEWRQQCQQSAAHRVDGIGLCGIHFNAGFRKPLTVVTELRLLGDGDI